MFKTKYSQKLDNDEKYLKGYHLLAIPFDKSTAICLKKYSAYENKIKTFSENENSS